MNNILYIIIGLVIVLLVVVVLMRKNKPASQDTATKPLNKPQPAQQPQPTIQPKAPVRAAADSSDNITDSTTAPTEPKIEDTLNTAQTYIDQQRYDAAIGELKRGLIQFPNDKNHLLKLLNVYAITKQVTEFNELFGKVQAEGDADAVASAENIKSLLDEEIAADEAATATAHLAHDEEPETIEGLDFDLDLSDNEPAPVEAANPVVVEDSLSLEDSLSFEDIDVSSDDTTLEIEETNSEISADEPTLSFDNLESQLLDDSTTTQNDTLSSDDSAFDLSLDDITSEDPSEESANLALDDTSPADEAANETTSFDDFSLDLNDSDETASVDTPVLEDTAASDNQAFELENFDSEDTTSEDSLTTDATEQAKTNELEDFVFDLNEETTDNANIESQIESDSSDSIPDTFSQLDDLDFDAIANGEFDTADPEASESEPTIEELASVEESEEGIVDLEPQPDTQDSVSLDSEVDDTPTIDLEEPAISDAAPTVAPALDAQFADDFDFVKDLDNMQITLDLATQYLELGEYDSAKRLLNEVIAQGNSEQQQQAQSLLTNAG